MKTNSCSMRFRIIMFVLTASVIAFAFIHSSMPSVESAQESESVLDFVTVILKLFGIEPNLSDHIIRKLAHLRNIPFWEHCSVHVRIHLTESNR